MGQTSGYSVHASPEPMGLLNLSDVPLSYVIGAFSMAALVIGVAGTYMSSVADRLADLTGLGEAMFGAVLLGGSTSISGIVTSTVTAYQGYPELSVSNAVGGIAAQTAFLAIADITYRRANLEHAAASMENLMHGVVLSLLLAVPLVVMTIPPVTVWSINPASVVLVVIYGFSMRLISGAREEPLWRPYRTRETQVDEPAPDKQEAYSLGGQWMKFCVLGILVGAAGYAVAHTGIVLVSRTGMSETIVGGLLTAVSTSLPELVTSIAAVRRGALTLAVGGVIGGNSFDVLFVAVSDAFYRAGSIYHAITERQIFVFSLSIILTSILLLGLLRRKKSGIANIGFESVLVLVLYVASFLLLFYIG